ncbi:G-protein-coupled receptor family protein [Tieghemostelium lacteum]|uniref:G-protein-coupled receptor family protein n=1 Tax=Tieghemostelium lacteum TaxID=361077 RepID=A0A151Z3M2_TIELA|nr:G-protein-coupled receptor family protein [Tieghemostelium lacteum]|eukprot:KYQ88404.1 G-protein-coupled receptor family protein [Tieghemostelium lacteum]
MSISVISIFLCIFFYQIFSVESQKGICKPYIGDPQETLLCNNRLINQNSIYTTSNTSQFLAQEVIRSLLFQVSTNDNCNIEPIRVGICQLNLPNCINATYGITVSLPSLICKSECEMMMAICPLFVGKIDCNNSTLFPVGSTYYNLTQIGGPAQYEVKCSKPSEIPGSSYNQQLCPQPLLVKNKTDPEFYASEGYNYVADSSCVLTCPINFFTEKQWDQLYKMSTVVSSFSFIGTLFTAITYGILNRKHNMHTVCVTLFAFSVWLMNFMDLITAGYGYRELLCPKPGKLAVQSDMNCAVTGTLFHFGVSSCVLWWTSISIHLLCKIKRWKPSFLQIRYFLMVNLTIGIVIIIAPLARKNIRAANGVLGCWIVDEQNGYFYIPFLIFISVGVFCILWVMKEIYIIVSTVHNDKRFIKLQLKPIIFVLLVFGSYFYIFCAHFYLDSKKQEYLDSTAAYVLCISQPFLTDETRALCGKPQGPGYGVIFAFYFIIRFFGIFLFLFYGLTKKSAEIWLGSIILKSKITQTLLSKLNISVDGVTNNSKNSGRSSEKKSSQKSVEMDVVSSSETF